MTKNKLTEIIAQDWLNAFPHLYKFKKNKFFKIVGCTIVGIELVNIPFIRGYKPHLVIYPLWRDTLKICLESPLLYRCINDRKGFEFSIPYSEHDRYITEAIECVKAQVPISFEANVSVGVMHNYVDQQFEDSLIKNHPAKQASLHELKFCYALYVGNEGLAKDILEMIAHESKSWNLQLFGVIKGPFDKWFKELQEILYDQNQFRITINKNSMEKELRGCKF